MATPPGSEKVTAVLGGNEMIGCVHLYRVRRTGEWFFTNGCMGAGLLNAAGEGVVWESGWTDGQALRAANLLARSME